MNLTNFGGAIALALALAACGETQSAATENLQSSERAQTPPAADQVHSGTGKVEAISGDQVTIAHGAVTTLGWPAMTMAFRAPSGVPQGVKAGSEVDFSFRQDSGAYVLTSVQPR